MQHPKRHLWAAASSAMVFAVLAAGCGGGGGNPGACFGSTQVCEAGTSTTPGSGGSLSTTPSTSSTTTSTTADTAVCSQFATQTEAQAYFFSHTAPQLDPDGDGLACN